MHLADIVDKIMISRGLTVSELARKAGIPQPRLYEIVTGKTKNPQMKTLQKLSTALGITVDSLTGYPEETPDPIIRKSTARIFIDEILDKKTDSEIKSFIHEQFKPLHSLPETIRIPVLGTVPAGFPEYVAEEVTEWVTRNDVPAGSYALRIKGDSMPPLVEGDYVAFIQNGDYRNGDRVVAHNEWGEFMVKRLRISPEGDQVLISDNPNYPNIEPNEHYRIIGKVVKGWRDII